METHDENIVVTDGRPWQIWVQRDLWTCETLTLFEKGVYTLLCGYADTKTRECYPSVGRIAKELGIAKRTARDALDGLVGKALLRREYRRARDARINDTNLYTILPFTRPPTAAATVGQQIPYATTYPTAPDVPGYGSSCPTVGQELPTNETHVTKPIERNPEVAGAAAPGADAPSEPAPMNPRKMLFGALQDAYQVPDSALGVYRGEFNKAVKTLFENDCTAEDVQLGYDKAKAEWEGRDFKAPALATWTVRWKVEGKLYPRALGPPGRANGRATRQPVEEEVTDEQRKRQRKLDIALGDDPGELPPYPTTRSGRPGATA